MTLTTVLLGSASFLVVLVLFLGAVGYAALLLRSRLQAHDAHAETPVESPMPDSPTAYWTKGNVGAAAGEVARDGASHRAVPTGEAGEVRTSERLENLLAYDEWCAIVERR